LPTSIEKIRTIMRIFLFLKTQIEDLKVLKEIKKISHANSVI